MINVLSQIQHVKVNDKNQEEVDAFTDQIKKIKELSEFADKSLTKISRSEKTWFFKVFMKIMK